ncbi:MAG TPA: isocitrate/isopropylmalate family dehydrogenase, partial [Thermoanaerobaculia bacterium]|nr:isocitrate/isopropylmalate family dehydrogenase [Thermoanaerobaculia bacterium]
MDQPTALPHPRDRRPQKIAVLPGDGIGKDVTAEAAKVLAAAAERWELPLALDTFPWSADHFLATGETIPEDAFEWLPRDYAAIYIGAYGDPRVPDMRHAADILLGIRFKLDLYINLRPIKLYDPRLCPLKGKSEADVDMVIFRENTEDIYAGIEFEEGTADNQKVLAFLKSTFPERYAKIRFPESSGLGFKPVSREGTERLVRAAIEYAIEHGRKSVTLVHKGNIMKFTEGAFRNWGFALAEKEFAETTYTWAQWEKTVAAKGQDAANAEQAEAEKAGKIVVKDAIADIALQQVLTRPKEFEVIATMNLNGDYLSDALAAQVGGLGMAPGSN